MNLLHSAILIVYMFSHYGENAHTNSMSIFGGGMSIAVIIPFLEFQSNHRYN